MTWRWARDRRFSPDLLERLNDLVLRGHHRLYAQRPGAWAQGLEFLLSGFPRMVRARSLRLFVLPVVLLRPLPSPLGGGVGRSRLDFPPCCRRHT